MTRDIRLLLLNMVYPKQQDHLTADWTRANWPRIGFAPLPTWQDALHRYLVDVIDTLR